MTRPAERIPMMLDLLRQAWERYPDQRLGQLVGNAARRMPDQGRPGQVGRYRDPFSVEDDEVWAMLQKIVDGEISLAPPGPGS